MKRFILMLAIVATLFACKKEDKIAKNLWKGDGIWNIEVWDSKTTSTYFEEDNTSEYLINMGTLQFNKDGSGKLTINNEGGIETFKYTNTSDKLAITFDYWDEGEQKVFDMDWKKNKLDLKLYTVDKYTTGDGNGGTVNVTYTHRLNMTCSKKK
ncbi:MAG: hypothetical protein H3C31_01860 [Brumimicrobium sp.]|nr:hypothetical protein [Brumimicrobium sp.]